jgi:hypothetical protein
MYSEHEIGDDRYNDETDQDSCTSSGGRAGSLCLKPQLLRLLSCLLTLQGLLLQLLPCLLTLLPGWHSYLPSSVC